MRVDWNDINDLDPPENVLLQVRIEDEEAGKVLYLLSLYDTSVHPEFGATFEWHGINAYIWTITHWKLFIPLEGVKVPRRFNTETQGPFPYRGVIDIEAGGRSVPGVSAYDLDEGWFQIKALKDVDAIRYDEMDFSFTIKPEYEGRAFIQPPEEVK